MGGRWIADSLGTYALVDSDEDLSLAIGLLGWHLADEPAPTDQVRIVLGEMNGRIPYGAMAEDGEWALAGWKPGPPPELAPADPPAVAPAKQTKAAAGGKSEEK